MLEAKKTVIDEDQLAISVQFSIDIGDKRAMGFTTGFPLDWDIAKINALLDKIIAAADRQKLKLAVKDIENSVHDGYRQIETNLQHQQNYVSGLQAAWVGRGKHGEFTMTENQKIEAKKWDTSVDGLRKAIAEKEKLLEDLRERCR